MTVTQERAFAEFQYAVNHWFQFMDEATRNRAATLAGVAVTELPSEPSVYCAVAPAKDRLEAEIKSRLEAHKPSGKGKVFVGTIWMINRNTGARARIPAEQYDAFVAQGFERGGPRSK